MKPVLMWEIIFYLGFLTEKEGGGELGEEK